MSDLAVICCDQGRLTDAVRLAQELADKNKRMWGEDHWETLLALNLAMVYMVQGRVADGASLQENVMAKWTGVLGGEHPKYAGCHEQPCVVVPRHGTA